MGKSCIAQLNQFLQGTIRCVIKRCRRKNKARTQYKHYSAFWIEE